MDVTSNVVVPCRDPMQPWQVFRRALSVEFGQMHLMTPVSERSEHSEEGSSVSMSATIYLLVHVTVSAALRPPLSVLRADSLRGARFVCLDSRVTARDRL